MVNTTQMKTILIVDDDKLAVDALKRLVSSVGIAVAASSVSRAVAVLATVQVDACLVDYDLGDPRENGGHLLAWLRANQPDLADRTVILSAHSGMSAIHHHALDKSAGPTKIREYLQSVIDSGNKN